jgi:hypothetical protein
MVSNFTVTMVLLTDTQYVFYNAFLLYSKLNGRVIYMYSVFSTFSFHMDIKVSIVYTTMCNKCCVRKL